MSALLRKAIAQTRAAQLRGRALPDQPPQMARALAALERRFPNATPAGRGNPVGDRVFLALAANRPVMALPAHDARRALRPAWAELMPDSEGMARVDAVVTPDWVRALTERLARMEWAPADRRLALVWLDLFPRGDTAEFLAQAARLAVARHSWPLRDAGERLALWDASEGPRRLGQALLTGEPRRVLDEAGLSSLPDAGIVQAALDRVADDVARSTVMAVRDVSALIELLEAMPGPKDARLSPALVHGLLAPWLNREPPPELKRRLQALLLLRAGDPRFKGAEHWKGLTRAMAARGYPQGGRIEALLLRWLIGEAFELFFKLLADTAGNTVQWQRRQTHWRRYLDAGRITNAWFLLGNDAAYWARDQGDRLKATGYGRLNGGVSSAKQSALLFKIGELTIAEWSDNGSCCFWRPGASQMPEFGARTLDGTYLRKSLVMEGIAAQDKNRTGKKLWLALPHQGSWEEKFDNAISRSIW
jgi:hypothetical protein